jgi:peptide chain release factor 1
MKKEHLFSVTKKDFKIDRFSGKGGGGQHRNKHQNCVRLHHSDSGCIVTGQSHKEYQSNLKEAFNNLIKHPKFKMWMNLKIMETKNKKTLEQIVDEMLDEKFLKVEYKKEGRWEEMNG